VFLCNVFVDEESAQQLKNEDIEHCNLTNVKHIELVSCGMMNLEKLKEAVEI